MRVLVACEYSGRVREAFSKQGHDAWSCDILPTDIPGNHLQCNVLEVLDRGWDLMIAFPPCTYLTKVGAKHWHTQKFKEGRPLAIAFVLALMNAPIPKIAVENPVGVLSRKIRKPDQIINPYQFGEAFKKATCLWLKNLPKLKATKRVKPTASYVAGINGRNRALERAKTFLGIAEAMADQWGSLSTENKIGFGIFTTVRGQK